MVDRVHPLAALAAAAPECEAVRLTTLPPMTRLLIRGDAASLDLPLPDVCRATTVDGNVLLWLGPDELLLLATDQAARPITVRPTGYIVDVSHRDTALTVRGPRAAWTINAFCALDLHLSAFPVGMCTRTVFGKAEIILWRIEADTFRIDIPRSFAPYVWACLEEARREFLG